MFIVSVFLAMFISWLITPVVIYLSHRFGLLDYPNDPRKIHKQPVPRFGSLPLLIGWLLGLSISTKDFRDISLLVTWIVAALILIGIGLLDDAGLLHSQIKLFIAMPLAALIALRHPVIRLYFFPDFTLNTVLTFFWLVGIPAAFNLLDGIDGLVSGVALFALFFFSLMNLGGPYESMGWAGLVLVGAVFGFLYWNFPPARIFLGDAGAIFLGFSAALLGVLAPINLPKLVSWTVPVLMLGLPIFDTFFVSVLRLRAGKIPFAAPGRDHTHHRLLSLGWSVRRTTLTLWGVSLLLNVIGFLLWRLRLPVWVYLFVIFLAMLGAIWGGVRLSYISDSTAKRPS